MAAPGQDRSPDEQPRRTVAEARARLGSAQKPNDSVPAYLRFVNRPAGGLIAAVGWSRGLRPNQITAISALFSFAAIAVIALVDPVPWVGFLVAALLLVGYAFDSADGQLARLRGGGSPAGEWLDHVTDASRNLALHSAVLVSLYRFGGLSNELYLLVPIAFLIVSGSYFFAMMLRDQLLRGTRRTASTEAPRDSVLLAFALAPIDYASVCLVFVLLSWTPAFLVAYSLLLAATALFAARSLPKAFRKLGAPDPGAQAPAGSGA